MPIDPTRPRDDIKGVLFLDSPMPDGRVPGIVYYLGQAHAVIAEEARFAGGAHKGARYLKFYPRPT